MQNDSSELLCCPSFNCYSPDNKLVDVAARVSRDLENDGVLNDEEFEFELVNLHENPGTSSFPVFNRDLLSNGEKEGDGDDDVVEDLRIPFRDLFLGDGDIPSSSSSEADELEGVPAGTYCVWTPKQSAESSPNRCKKSKSTGSCSKRWRLKDLLKRSNSDGKVSSSSSSSSSSSLFLSFERNPTEKKREEKMSEKAGTTKKKSEAEVEVKATKTKTKKGETVPSAHEVFYVRNRTSKEGDKRRSYLPYRQDLVGIFANVHGLGRTFPPF